MSADTHQSIFFSKIGIICIMDKILPIIYFILSPFQMKCRSFSLLKIFFYSNGGHFDEGQVCE